MYQYRRSPQRKTNFSRGNIRKVRSFDPTHLINNTPQKKVEEVAYVPTHTFASFAISEDLKKNILAKGYVTPTPIQDQSIPHILEGKDIVGIANTGTGKTASFLIPLLDGVIKNKGNRVLVIAPTRELAYQIKNELNQFARDLGVYCTLCIGGESMYAQRQDLRRNPQFVIGTPGRMKDLINQRGLILSQFTAVVLDEVDQMLDFGFIRDIEYITSLLPEKRQSLFFSATIDDRVKGILTKFVHNPITVSVKKQDLLHNITHSVVKVVDQKKKLDQLHEMLNKSEFEKVIIFGRTKWGVQRLSDELVKRGLNADVIHGNKRQAQRLKILEQFKRNSINILLATDIASRGLDIDEVTHVINYDPPESYESYIHRIGRTGRGSKSGTAITFIS